MRADLARILRAVASRLDPRPPQMVLLDEERIAAIADQQIDLAFHAAADGYRDL